MYCKKCGKEVADSAKFCRYCGTPIDFKEQDPIESQESMDNFEDVDDVKVVKYANRRKWVVPVCIAAGVAVLAGTGVLAMNMSKAKKEDTKKAEQAKKEADKKAESAEVEKEADKKVESAEIEKEEVTQQEETKTEEKQEAEVMYPQEITLDADVVAQLRNFIEILGYCENSSSWMADGKKLPEFSNAELSKTFLVWASKLDGTSNKMKNKYDCTVTDSGYCLITEENAEKFLISSIGQYDNSIMDYDGDKIISMLGNMGSTGVETVNISGVTGISDTDIKVDGDLSLHSSGVIKRKIVFSILMTANPDSIWGGYTLKSIDKWEEGSLSSVKNVTKQDFTLSSGTVLQEAGYDYSVASLTDMNTQTCWVEGVSGVGEGECITFSSDTEKTVSGLAILPGYLKSSDLFEQNGMPLEIEITADGKSWTQSFDNFQPNFSSPMDSMVYVDFGEYVDISKCTVTLTRCRSGSMYDDSCITEMFLYKEIIN